MAVDTYDDKAADAAMASESPAQVADQEQAAQLTDQRQDERQAFSDAWNERSAKRVERQAGTPETFGSAFKQARASGQATFEYGGKKYSTRLKGESGAKPVAKAAAKPDLGKVGESTAPKSFDAAKAPGKPDLTKWSADAKTPDDAKKFHANGRPILSPS